MTEYHYLLGAEDALRASHTMDAAADSMKRAADTFATAMERHERVMREMLDRMELLHNQGAQP